MLQRNFGNQETKGFKKQRRIKMEEETKVVEVKVEENQEKVKETEKKQSEIKPEGKVKTKATAKKMPEKAPEKVAAPKKKTSKIGRAHV